MTKEVHLKKDLNLVLTSRPFQVTVFGGNMKTRSKPSIGYAVQVVKLGLLMILLFPLLSFSQDKGEELDRLFNYYNQNGMFNGAVLAAEKGKVIYEKAFGFADFSEKTPLKTSSIFAVGSITKSFTAAAIMMLKERGIIQFTDEISTYFPQLSHYAEGVTIRHLLTHTSGIIDYLSRGLKLQQKLPEVTSEIVLENLASQTALEFKPGEKFSYSNSNYVLLAQIIEMTSHRSYGSFLEENIFAPLGMNQTFVYEGDEETLEKIVKSYVGYWEISRENEKLKAGGDGNIYSTVEDLQKFMQSFFALKLIRANTFDEAFDETTFLFRSETNKSRYGFGWEMLSHASGKIVYHRGSIAGFCGQLWCHPAQESILIILCNTPWLTESADILEGAEEIMKGNPYTLGKISAFQLFNDNWFVKGFDAGFQLLKKALSDEGSNYYIYPYEIHGIGYTSQMEGDFKTALEVFKFSIELFPDNFHLFDSLGEVYLELGDKSNALKSYKRALEINPKLESALEAVKKLEVKK
jgi:CubicO group peptidase (beta-lactamase class C family)